MLIKTEFIEPGLESLDKIEFLVTSKPPISTFLRTPSAQNIMPPDSLTTCK